MKPLKTLVVDDEPLARQRLVDLLAGMPEVEVVGEAATGAEALEMLRKTSPDLMFLDINMPEMSGLETLKQVEPERRPAVIFATAHDEYAVNAFEEHAVDYLLKPISLHRLCVAVERVSARGSGSKAQSSQDGVDRLLRGLERASSYRTRVTVRSSNRFVVVEVTDILYIEAADNYVRLHTADASYLYRSTMSGIERVLDPKDFLRIHRSLMIRVDQVKMLEPWGLGEYSFVLESGKKLISSRSYRRSIREAFGI
jgi:two-component system, LytTR family, response regulator